MKYLNFDFRGRRKKFAVAFVLLSLASTSNLVLADSDPSDEQIIQSCEHFRKFFESASKEPKTEEQVKAWLPFHERLEKVCGIKIPLPAPKKGVVGVGEIQILEVGPEERSSGAAN
jgi:hypothetical protein